MTTSPANIRIEVLCNAEVADRIVSTDYDRFSANYRLVVYAMDVDVMRAGKL